MRTDNYDHLTVESWWKRNIRINVWRSPEIPVCKRWKKYSTCFKPSNIRLNRLLFTTRWASTSIKQRIRGRERGVLIKKGSTCFEPSYSRLAPYNVYYTPRTRFSIFLHTFLWISNAQQSERTTAVGVTWNSGCGGGSWHTRWTTGAWRSLWTSF